MQRLGLREEAEIVGTTDFDWFPPLVARKFISDDQHVLQTGQPLINRVEMWYNEQRIFDWFVTNKFPVRDADGRVVGLIGTVQSYESKERFVLPYVEIRKAVDFIREHYHERITVQELASQAHLSVRQLHRKFLQAFGMNVRDFLIKTRIQAASDMLVNSNASIAKIAIDFGFCDQSAFTQQFRRHTGLTPLKFRTRYSRV